MEINIEIARKVLETVDAGLVKGVGKPIPGQMCVEAAVCYAMGLPHGDDPACVAPALRSFKIRLNDANWSSNNARAAGLRRLSIVQLGSASFLDEIEFRRRLVDWSIGTCVPLALRASASVQKSTKHKSALLDHASRCEKERTQQSAIDAERTAAAYSAYSAAASAYCAAAYAAAYSAYSAACPAAAVASAAADAADEAADAYARDKTLARFAEDIVQILIEMKVPGVQWLELAPLDIAHA